MKAIVIFILILGMSFAHEPSLNPSIIKRIEDKYSYRDWSEDEYRMLRILLHVGHHHGPLNDDDKFIIDENNQVLRARIAKEVFLTEDLADSNSAHIVSKAGGNFQYGYTSGEIKEFIRQQLPTVGELAKSQDGANPINIVRELQFIQWMHYYGTSSDLDIFDYIEENIQSDIISEKIKFVRKRIEDKEERGVKNFTEFEQNQSDLDARIKNKKDIAKSDGVESNSNRIMVYAIIALILSFLLFVVIWVRKKTV